MKVEPLRWAQYRVIKEEGSTGNKHIDRKGEQWGRVNVKN